MENHSQFNESSIWNARSHVRVNGIFSDNFLVYKRLHQGFVLCPLLFIIVLEAIPREIRSVCHEELLHVDDLESLRA